VCFSLGYTGSADCGPGLRPVVRERRLEHQRHHLAGHQNADRASPRDEPASTVQGRPARLANQALGVASVSGTFCEPVGVVARPRPQSKTWAYASSERVPPM
jgi:hypothetical protein